MKKPHSRLIEWLKNNDSTETELLSILNSLKNRELYDLEALVRGLLVYKGLATTDWFFQFDRNKGLTQITMRWTTLKKIKAAKKIVQAEMKRRVPAKLLDKWDNEWQYCK